MNVPYGTPLTAPHVTTGGYADGKQLTKEGRHVGLDFYDLLIEGVYTSLRRLFAGIPVKIYKQLNPGVWKLIRADRPAPAAAGPESPT